ncbi:MAG: biopolymer transporter ExbD [Victivallales bacterium]|nr:biopolymer transporter ExbD [Victivallales bacterium]
MDFKKKFQEHGAGFQMAPMLDIVFILLIHFMAATIFAQWDNKLEIKVPTAANAAENDIRQYGEVILNIDRDGKVFIGSNEIPEAQLVDLLGAISATFKDEPCIIRPDRDTSCQHLVHVLDLCRGANVWNVSIATAKPQPSEPASGTP